MAKPAPLVAGDTWKAVWFAPQPNGQPVDLTGATARLHLRDAAGAKIVEASTADGRIVIDGPAGKLFLTVPAIEMALVPGNYRFALEVTYADGTVRTEPPDTLTIRDDPTP